MLQYKLYKTELDVTNEQTLWSKKHTRAEVQVFRK